MNRIVIMAFACLLILPFTSPAQTRSRTTKRGTQAAKPSAQQTIADAKTTGATKVADQIKNLTRFVYLLGGVAKAIELTDESARRGEATPAEIDQNNKSKASVKTSLQGEREALDQLEIYFRGTPGLLDYYLKLAGSASGAATAEDQAASGHFDQAGRTLLGVVNRLTDVLLVMR